MNEKEKPIRIIKLGNVSCSVWEQKFEDRIVHSFSFSKTYKNKDGKFAYTGFFKGEDLAKLYFIVKKLAEQSMVNFVPKANPIVEPDANNVDEDIPF